VSFLPFWFPAGYRALFTCCCSKGPRRCAFEYAPVRRGIGREFSVLVGVTVADAGRVEAGIDTSESESQAAEH
jgi:hypothetical protein